MTDPAALVLVEKAIKSGLGGCVEWDITVVDRLDEELARHGLKLHEVRRELIQHVRNGGKVFQHEEDREGWKNKRDYWYHVIMPMPGVFAKGLFVEFELRNSDSDLPEVNLVQAHEER
jgi:hypothetical protein